ncbi:MAG: histidinol-phosphate transaminase [Polyangiaceae bacterium]
MTRRIAAEELVRPAYRAMDLYAPLRKPCAIDLSDNTNLRGVPPSAKAALADVVGSTVTRYPSLYGAELKRAIGAYVGVDPENVVTGCGSDDILDSAIRAMSEPGDAIAFADPTFQMLSSFASMNSLEARVVPLLSPERDRDIDDDGLVRENARITYVCSPNNPTGSLASPRAIDKLLESARGVVIVDEAYVEYAIGAGVAESLVRRAPTEPRLLVVRTLSKAFGLAGLRVGYAVGPRALVDAVEKSRGPYKVTAIAERMAVAALDHDREWVRESVAEVLESRAKFEVFLREIGRAPLPSAANFVLVPIDRAVERGLALRERGVAVRPFPSVRGVGDALRISVGPWGLMEQTLSTFEAVLA